MLIFVDSANEKHIRQLCREGIVDGVTTNPSIMLKDGVQDIETAATRLRMLLGDRPLSLEVTSNDHQEMLE